MDRRDGGGVVDITWHGEGPDRAARLRRTCGLVAHPGSSEAAAKALRALGFEVRTALAGADRAHRPDVVVAVEVPVPPAVPRAWTGVPVVAVRFTPCSRDRVVSLLAAGADAVVQTGLLAAPLVAAIETVANGGAIVDAQVARDLVRLVRAGRPSGAVRLTARERDVLDTIRRDRSVAAAAAELGIAEKTVRNVQTRLFAKLGARSRVQALMAASDLGLLDARPS